MSRLLIHVEGETEETFVNEILAPHLYNFGYQSVGARKVGNARLRENRGGIRAWSSVRRDIICHLREDPGCIATTMVDYYGLPATGDRAWPGRSSATLLPFNERQPTLQSQLAKDINEHMGVDFNPNRFIAFVIMHEFEGLLFSDCTSFAKGIGCSHLSPVLQQIREAYPNPEEINDSPETAPSKRIKKLIPEYEKPLQGNLAILEIGLDKIRSCCSNFDQWMIKLEQGCALL